jgi:hypothetical protein
VGTLKPRPYVGFYEIFPSKEKYLLQTSEKNTNDQQKLCAAKERGKK